jgi:uncharacterized protein Yka (UPF0111/DUF47 family)
VPKFSIIPREPKFFDLFERSVANVATAAKELANFFENYTNLPQKVARLTELEHQGDYITHQIMEQLHRTFVTPLDREDIALLTERLDDVMDFIEGAANAMLLYRIEQPTKRARELADVLVAMTDELVKAVPRLRNRSEMRSIALRSIASRTKPMPLCVSPLPSYSMAHRSPMLSSGARSMNTWKTPRIKAKM